MAWSKKAKVITVSVSAALLIGLGLKFIPVSPFYDNGKNNKQTIVYEGSSGPGIDLSTQEKYFDYIMALTPKFSTKEVPPATVPPVASLPPTTVPPTTAPTTVPPTTVPPTTVPPTTVPPTPTNATYLDKILHAQYLGATQEACAGMYNFNPVRFFTTFVNPNFKGTTEELEKAAAGFKVYFDGVKTNGEVKSLPDASSPSGLALVIQYGSRPSTRIYLENNSKDPNYQPKIDTVPNKQTVDAFLRDYSSFVTAGNGLKLEERIKLRNN
jgi:hypothetical protein